MNNFFMQETALLACLNDSQSLKKKENIAYFRDSAFAHKLFADIFMNHSNARMDYPEAILPVIEKAEVAREKQLLDHYVDVIKRYRQKSIHILQVTDSEYPLKLAEIPDPPLMIYVRGRMESLSRPAVAIVGTRNISPDGAKNVQEIVGFFVQLGYTIVSGLALGTDTCAHRAALELGGETIAVLPGDIENVVPKENQELAENISRSGSLVSEITPLTKMHKGRYIERNRITSALSRAVIVIETGESGGSIRQAETAFKQGAPVYVVRPDSTNERAVAGFDKLVLKGATPINNLHDLFTYFGKAQNTTSRMTTLADFS